MIFELMSNGSMAELPQAALPKGIPDIPGPRAVLLLPYNRYLLGHSFMRNYERWIWGKPGIDPQEVFLYENGPQSLTLDETTRVTIPSNVILEIRNALFSQMQPPGEHLPTVLILRGVLKEHSAFKDDVLVQNEPAFLQFIDKDNVLGMTYWAVRFALFRGEFETIARVKTWLRAASDLFDSNEPSPHGHAPKVWFSLTPLPGGKELSELEALSFSVDDLQRMVSQSALPVVLFSKSGYLVLSDFGGAGGAFRVWVFLPAFLWNELRERRKLSIRDLVISAWGYCDAVQASAERTRYAPSPKTAAQLTPAN
ncbi:MAG: hypothetical protein FWG71_08755 [Synergistaceae bacterium]|nr:hypothetical protein [Synergistaceae bacterium]